MQDDEDLPSAGSWNSSAPHVSFFGREFSRLSQSSLERFQRAVSNNHFWGINGYAMSHSNRHRKSTKPRLQISTAPEQTADTSEADPRDDKCIIDRIRIRAFEISQDRAGGPGDERSDWLQAERELKLVDK